MGGVGIRRAAGDWLGVVEPKFGTCIRAHADVERKEEGGRWREHGLIQQSVSLRLSELERLKGVCGFATLSEVRIMNFIIFIIILQELTKPL